MKTLTVQLEEDSFRFRWEPNGTTVRVAEQAFSYGWGEEKEMTRADARAKLVNLRKCESYQQTLTD